MLHSAFLALKNLNDDIIISYSDIIYDKEILRKIKEQKSKNILIPIKSNWKSVWKIRKKIIKKDAENLKFNNKNYLQSIGLLVFQEERLSKQLFLKRLFLPF